LTADNPAWEDSGLFAHGTQLAYWHGAAGFEAMFSYGAAESEIRGESGAYPDWDRSIASFAWASDGKTLFAATDHLVAPLWAVDSTTGRHPPSRAGEVEGFSVGTRKVFMPQQLRNPPILPVGFAGGEPSNSRA